MPDTADRRSSGVRFQEQMTALESARKDEADAARREKGEEIEAQLPDSPTKRAGGRSLLPT